MRYNLIKRQWISCLCAFSFLIQPLAQAQTLAPHDGLRLEMGQYLKEAGYFNGSMTHGQFASLVAKQLPEDGAMIVLGLAKPIWNKKMPRMQISATPFLRMTIHDNNRVYTLEVINSEKHFARFNGELITWEELLDPKAFSSRILQEASEQKKTASLLMSLLFPSAHAVEDDMFVDMDNIPAAEAANQSTQSAEPSEESLPSMGSTEPVPTKETTASEAGEPAAQPWYQSMFGGVGIGPIAIVAAVLGGAYLIGNGLKKDSKEPVVVETPEPEPRMPASTEPEPKPLENRFELIAAKMPETKPTGIIGGVRTIQPGGNVRVLPREMNTSEGKKPIF